jgi:hypothetical protein
VDVENEKDKKDEVRDWESEKDNLRIQPKEKSKSKFSL